MAEQDRDDELVSRLVAAGWRPGGETWYPDGIVEVKLRPSSETSGKPVRSIVGTDFNDAIRKELKRLEDEGI